MKNPSKISVTYNEVDCQNLLKAVQAFEKELLTLISRSTIAAITNRAIRTIRCAVCGRTKLRETDYVKRPGHYSRIRAKYACQCIEDAMGRTIKAGPA